MRLTTKLALFLVVSITSIQIISGFAIVAVIRDTLVTEGKTQLTAAADQFKQQMVEIENQVGGGVTVLTLDYALRQAIAAHDHETVLSALRNHGKRVGASRMMLLETDGTISADTAITAIGGGQATARPNQNRFPFPTLFVGAEERKRSAAIAVIDGEPTLLVVVPVLAPDPLAYVAVLVSLNRPFLDRMHRLSGLPLSTSLDILFEDGGWHVAPGAGSASSKDIIGVLDQVGNAPAVFSVSNSEEVLVKIPLAAVESSPRVIAVMDYPMADVIRHYRWLPLVLLGAVATGLLAALAGVMVMTRQVGGPIEYLAARARRIAGGDYTEVTPIPRNDEIGQLSEAVETMTHAIAEREGHIRHQAEHDAITGLLNRQAWSAIVDRKLGSGDAAVLVLAIVRLREIANTVGPDITENVIRDAARRLTDLYEQGQIGYIGGQSFAVFLPEHTAATSQAEAQRVFVAFETAYHEGDLTIDSGIAIGIALAPKHGTHAASLLHHAGVAQHEAALINANFSIYDESRDPYRPAQLSLMGELRQGTRNGEFQMLYQPKLELRTGQITGAEAVVRWNHPHRGFLSPDIFIGLAEQTGNVQYLTRWVITETLQQIAKWRRKGLNLKISVNASTRDLEDQNFPEFITELLVSNDIPPEVLILEVTESAIMVRPDAAVSTLQKLSAMNIGLAIDDFGIGNASLSYLQLLPVREIKIDKSFVRGLALNHGDRSIVRAILQLGHALDYTVTAEGVEDQESVDILRSLGCDFAQGYLIAKPISPVQFVDFLDTWNDGQEFRRMTLASS